MMNVMNSLRTMYTSTMYTSTMYTSTMYKDEYDIVKLLYMKS